jgi:hypothetical protein
VCSDVIHDGVYLEVQGITNEPHVTVADVFYSDQSHYMVFSTYRENLPFELVEWLIQEAKADLPRRAWKDRSTNIASS